MTVDALTFTPVLKRLVWGGRRLGDLLGKPLGDANDYAESWEIVDHGDDQSVVDQGPRAGRTLHELVLHERDWLLGAGAKWDEFPLLLKYLDCERVLSVQVHPDDAYAALMKTPDRGKTEAWYIVDAAPKSLVYAGLRQGVKRHDLELAIAAGAVETLLHAYHPAPGDCLFIPAGTVHALGAGLLVAEIQQSSDTTFRIYDWNRTDASGRPRELHVEQALDVINFDAGPVHPVARRGGASGWQILVSCDKFSLSTLENGSDNLEDIGRCRILTAPRGTATVSSSTGSLTLARGQSVLLPAAAGAVRCEVFDGGCLLEMHPTG